jgi:hypothetical protein
MKVCMSFPQVKSQSEDFVRTLQWTSQSAGATLQVES